MKKLLIFLLWPILASAQFTVPMYSAGQIAPLCTTPVGTTFAESFGDTGSGACGFNSNTGCTQLWNNISGGASIVTSPGTPAANTACGYSLNFVASGSANNYIQTVGTFPKIPAGTTFDLYFDVYATATSLPTYDDQMLWCGSSDAGCSGSDYPVKLTWYTTTAGALSVRAIGSTTSSQVAVSLNAWHTIHLHLASGGANSYLQVDAGTQATFTENAYSVVYQAFGNHVGTQAAVTYNIGYVQLNSAVGGSGGVSAWMNFENGSNGDTATAANLLSGTQFGNGVWTPNTGTPTMTISTSGQETLQNSFTVAGQTETDTGTRGLAYNDSSSTHYYWNYTFATLSHTASWGMYFMQDTQLADYRSTLGGFLGSGTSGGAGGCSFGTHGAYFRFECGGATGIHQDTTIGFSAGTWYWITCQYIGDGTSNSTCKWYDYTGTNLLGTYAFATGETGIPYDFMLGWTSASGTGGANEHWYYDNVKLDYVNGTFPLLP